MDLRRPNGNPNTWDKLSGDQSVRQELGIQDTSIVLANLQLAGHAVLHTDNNVAEGGLDR